MIGTVEMLWILLSFIVSCINTISLMQPNWLVNPDTFETVGLLSYCSHSSFLKHFRNCGFYGNNFIFDGFPSTTWRMCAILLAVSTLLMTLSVTVAVFAAAHLGRRTREVVARAASYTQALAVLLSCSAIIIFPAVFGEESTRIVCPASRSYAMGQCEIGWSYMLAISGSAIAVFCPYLAQHIDVFLEECDPPQIFAERHENVMSRERTFSSFKSTSTQSSFVT